MNSERDNCGLSSILPISCRDRAEAFARTLQSRLSSLGGHDVSPNNERSWLGPHERPVTLSQPLQNSNSTDRFYDLEQDVESPLSPQDELGPPEFHVLLNKDTLNGIDGDCHCPKFTEDDIQKQFFVKTNGLTKCTSNESVDSEIFYDLDDDPPSAHYIIGVKNSESSKSINSDLNSQGTSSSNPSEAYCTSLDCTPQNSLSNEVSTLSIQKLSESSSASDLNGLSERSSSDESSGQLSSDETRNENGYSENYHKLNGNIHLNSTNHDHYKNIIGCREELNIENSVGAKEFGQNTKDNSKVNGKNHATECFYCDREEESCKCDIVENGDSSSDHNGTVAHTSINIENRAEKTKLHLELAKKESIALNEGDCNGYQVINEKDCNTNETNQNGGEDLVIKSIDETDFKVIENGDGIAKSEIVACRVDIEIQLSAEDDGKDKTNDKTEETKKDTIKTPENDEADDSSDDDDTIPHVRRCSSLRTGKTPPGTPGRKKIVRFADVLGLDLADVRTFLDEIPKVPKSAYDDLSDVDITDSSDSSDLVTLGGIKYHGIKTDRILVPMFEQPAILPNFLDLVRDFQVCLENCFVDDPVLFSIRGFARVRNLDFNKSVHIRYSLDSWVTFSDVQATYCSNSCDGFSDKFSFIIYANTLQVGQRIEFACRFQCKGFQYWDNNKGKNYVFQCLPAASPANSATCPSQVVRARVNTHEDWGASFY